MVTRHQEPEIVRSRLFLITPPDYEASTFASELEATLKAGDVASLLILPPHDGDYAKAAETLVPLAQSYGVASLLYNDSQLMGRTKADGLHLDGAVDDIVETVKAHAGREIMGVGDIRSRHDAMVMGEGPIDYLFFGRLDGDTNANIFPKAFKLAEWWASLFEIPCVVMGGNTVASVTLAADEAIDFVALRGAIWNHETSPSHAIREANDLLDTIFEERKALLDA